MDIDDLDTVLVAGRTPGPVTLVEPDPSWPSRYAERAAAIRRALGGRVLRLEHVGSTSVPGLVAKPIIDIALGVADPDDEAAYLPALDALGYIVRVRQPGHRCLRVGEPGDQVNLHCYAPDSDEITRYLAFRDRLRACAVDRDAYAALKRSLAPRDWPDVNYYADAKGPLIREILARAGQQLVLTQELRAEPDIVFDAWITPSVMRRWMFTSDTGEIVHVTADAEPGGTYSILEYRAEGEIDHYGTYTVVDRPRRLEFTLHVPAHFAETSTVSVTIEPADGGSLLTFVQRGIDPDQNRGFWVTMLGDLATLLGR